VHADNEPVLNSINALLLYYFIDNNASVSDILIIVQVLQVQDEELEKASLHSMQLEEASDK
jgi:hypothetical protein